VNFKFVFNFSNLCQQLMVSGVKNILCTKKIYRAF